MCLILELTLRAHNLLGALHDLMVLQIVRLVLASFQVVAARFGPPAPLQKWICTDLDGRKAFHSILRAYNEHWCT